VNPGTIQWQAAVVASLLIAMTLIVAPATTLLLAGPALAAATGLNAAYARKLGRRGRPKRRIDGDRWVARFVAVGLVLPLLLALVLVLAGYDADVRVWDFTVAETAAVAIAAAALFTLILLSSLIDWYYIRPRIDGVIAAPPCRSSGPDTWKRPTRRWFIHRGLATIAYILFALTLALVVMIMLVREHPAVAGVIGGVGGIASLLLIFAGDYRAQLPTVAKWALSPAYCLGDDLSYAGYRTGGRGFVLHVAVPVTKLVPLDEGGNRTEVAFVERKNTDLAEAELIPRRTHACDGGCVKLNAQCVVGLPRRDARKRLLIL
jgi:hypothetical protein